MFLYWTESPAHKEQYLTLPFSLTPLLCITRPAAVCPDIGHPHHFGDPFVPVVGTTYHNGMDAACSSFLTSSHLSSAAIIMSAGHDLVGLTKIVTDLTVSWRIDLLQIHFQTDTGSAHAISQNAPKTPPSVISCIEDTPCSTAIRDLGTTDRYWSNLLLYQSEQLEITEFIFFLLRESLLLPDRSISSR